MAGLTTVMFGCANDQGAPNVRFGIAKGFFADEGIDLRIHRVYGGPELAREFAAGRVAIGEFGSPPALTAIAGGCPIKIVASGTRRKFMMTLAVRTGITDWPELKDARVGLLSPGSCTEWLAREMWRKHGLDPDKDLHFVVLREDHARIVEIMRDGGFDAFLATEPRLSQAEMEGLADAWCNGYDAPYVPRFQWGVMVARPDFIADHPERVRAVIRGAVRAARYGATHVDEWAAFNAEYYGLPLAVAWRALERSLPHYELDGRLDLDGLDRAVALQRALGAFDRSLSLADIVDTRCMPEQAAA